MERPLTREELHNGPSFEDLPEDIQQMDRDETVCGVCGVSYLIFSEVKQLEKKIAEAGRKLEREQRERERDKRTSQQSIDKLQKENAELQAQLSQQAEAEAELKQQHDLDLEAKESEWQRRCDDAVAQATAKVRREMAAQAQTSAKNKGKFSNIMRQLSQLRSQTQAHSTNAKTLRVDAVAAFKSLGSDLKDVHSRVGKIKTAHERFRKLADHQRKDMNAQLTSEIQRMRGIRDKNTTLSAELSTALTRSDAITTQLQEVQKALKEAERKHKERLQQQSNHFKIEAKKRSDTFGQELADLRAAADRTEQELRAKLDEEIKRQASLRQRNGVLELQLQATADRAEQDLRAQLHKESSALTLKLDQQIEENKNLSLALAKAQGQLHTVSQELEHGQLRQSSALDDKVKELEQAKLKFEDQWKELQDTHQREMEALKGEHEHELKTLRIEHEETLSTLDRLRNDLAKVGSASSHLLEEARAECSENKAKVKKLRNELVTIKGKLTEADLKLTTQRQRVHVLEDAKDQLQQELASVTVTRDDLISQLKQAKAKQDELLIRISDRERSLKQLQAKADLAVDSADSEALMGTIEQLRHQVEKLQDVVHEECLERTHLMAQLAELRSMKLR